MFKLDQALWNEMEAGSVAKQMLYYRPQKLSH